MGVITKQQMKKPMKERCEPATLKQINYLKQLSKATGFAVVLNNITKYKAAEQIEQLKKIIEGQRQRKIKENEVKLAMVKKLVYKKWVAMKKEINRHTVREFANEVFYINKIFMRIDEVIASGKAA